MRRPSPPAVPARRTARRGSSGPAVYTLGLLVVGAAAAWGIYSLNAGADGEPGEFDAPPVEPAAGPSPAEAYARDIAPLLGPFDARNGAAVDRAVSAVRTDFEGYRAGVPKFAEEMTDWGTRFSILRRGGSDWWEGDGRDRVGRLVSGKMERHVVSDAALERSVRRAADRLRDDLAASRNELLMDVNAALGRSDVRVSLRVDDATVGRVRAAFDERLKEELARGAADTLKTAVLSEVQGAALGFVVEQLVVQVAVRAGLLTAAAGGGAMAGGAATGGALGTVGGPAGVAVGVGAGLIVGLLVDWWQSGKLEARLTATMNDYLDALETSLIDGTGEVPGVGPQFQAARRQLRGDAATALRAAVLGGD